MKSIITFLLVLALMSSCGFIDSDMSPAKEQQSNQPDEDGGRD